MFSAEFPDSLCKGYSQKFAKPDERPTHSEDGSRRGYVPQRDRYPAISSRKGGGVDGSGWPGHRREKIKVATPRTRSGGKAHGGRPPTAGGLRSPLRVGGKGGPGGLPPAYRRETVRRDLRGSAQDERVPERPGHPRVDARRDGLRRALPGPQEPAGEKGAAARLSRRMGQETRAKGGDDGLTFFSALQRPATEEPARRCASSAAWSASTVPSASTRPLRR